jgi:hypothetical protein
MPCSLCLLVLSGVGLLIGASDAEPRPGDRALCARPPAAMVHAQATQSAVVPRPAPIEHDPCQSPRAACVLPAAHCVNDDLPRCPSANEPVAALLRRWETASANQPAWSPRDREWLRRQSGDNLSAHALDLVVRLTQPVTVAALRREFDWQLTPADDAGIVLAATPRDDAARLFCSELHIELDAGTSRPRAVDVIHRGGRQRLVIQPEVVLTAHVVVESDEDFDVPPSPSTTGAGPLIRFATGPIEIVVE